MNKLLSMQDITKKYNTSEENLEMLKHIEFLVDETEFDSILGSAKTGKQPMMTIIGCLDVSAFEQCEHQQVPVASSSLMHCEVSRKVSA
ncbi:hypothetical protein [Acetobacterium tundrae]|uniref:Transposase n=1 Tax=Acetobacterium tundrae TaxID=132932 RepID=A0ABR6WI31_9FIRM|nr:hypothetical protein [Acetobacterium tundrae]MBC3796111.1 hypothetical protein [Acetobacterium tundrae]